MQLVAPLGGSHSGAGLSTLSTGTRRGALEVIPAPHARSAGGAPRRAGAHAWGPALAQSPGSRTAPSPAPRLPARAGAAAAARPAEARGHLHAALPRQQGLRPHRA